MRKKPKQQSNKPIASGPKPERLKINENWKAAMKKSLAKKKPAKGWPK